MAGMHNPHNTFRPPAPPREKKEDCHPGCSLLLQSVWSPASMCARVFSRPSLQPLAPCSVTHQAVLLFPPITPGSPPSRRLTTSQCHQVGDRCLSLEHQEPSLQDTHRVHSHHHCFCALGEEGKTQKWHEQVPSPFKRAVADPHWEAAAGSLVCPPRHVPPVPASPC